MKRKLISEILSGEVISVPPGAPLADALSIMTARNISCVVVAEGGRPLGIITERGVVFAISGGAGVNGLTVSDIMSRDIISATTEMDVYEAFHLFETRGIRHLVVVDTEDTLAGVVTQTDIRGSLGLEYFFEIKHVSKIMTKTVSTVKKDSSVLDAIRLMARNSISCVIVEEGMKPHGILTERDVVRLITDGVDLLGTMVHKVMSRPVQTISREKAVVDASNLMDQKHIRRLIVVDDEGRVEGLITQTDIIRQFERGYIKFLKAAMDEKEKELKKTREVLSERVILENILRSTDNLAIIATDLNFNILYHNADAERMFRQDDSGFAGKTLKALLSAHVGPDVFSQWFLRVKGEGRFGFDIELEGGHGRRVIESRVSGILDEKSCLIGFVVVSQDITERKAGEAVLKSNLMAMEASIDGMAILNSRGEYIYLNRAHAAIYGYDRVEDLMGRSWKELYDREELERFDKEIMPEIQRTGHWRGEAVGLRRDGTAFHQELSLNIHEGRFLCVVRDITERKMLEEKLRALSVRDELTGLFNRRGFFDFAPKQLKLSCRNEKDATLLYMDMDNLKGINDTHGHIAGDEALVALTSVLTETFRDSDIIARIGGDEFAVLMPDAGEEHCKSVLERFYKSLAAASVAVNGKYTLSVSIGSAHFFSGEPCSVDELIVMADAAMYEMKRDNRN